MNSSTLSLRGTETILVAEDEDGVRSLTREVLEKYGYTVLEAANGEEALKVAERYQGPLHLLLSDVVMPGIGGPELAVRLRMRRPTLRVLLMSGYDEHSLAAGGAGYASFIAKPFRPELLSQRVRAALDSVETIRPVS